MEKKRLILKGRRHKTRPCLTLNNHPLAILAVWYILLSSLPAFYSCNRHGDAFEDTDLKECTVCLKSADVDKISGLDVFFLQRLTGSENSTPGSTWIQQEAEQWNAPQDKERKSSWRLPMPVLQMKNAERYVHTKISEVCMQNYSRTILIHP